MMTCQQLHGKKIILLYLFYNPYIDVDNVFTLYYTNNIIYALKQNKIRKLQKRIKETYKLFT